MSNHNGSITCERYGGTLLVYVPQLKWYQLGVPYTSELERVPPRSSGTRSVSW